MSTTYKILITYALLVSHNLSFTSIEAPETREAAISQAKKRKCAAIVLERAYAQAASAPRRPLPFGPQWHNWISALPDDESILNRITEAAKRSGSPFRELRENGNLYFAEVPAHSRFFDNTNEAGSQAIQYRNLTSLSAIRRCGALPVSQSNNSIAAFRHLVPGEAPEQIQDSVTRRACKFRPYAIALTLGNCLWPKENQRYCDVPLSTSRLATLWAMHQHDAYELLLEKARYLEKAYEIYREVREKDIAVPTISADQIFSLEPCWLFLQPTDLIKLRESLNKQNTFDNVILNTARSHLWCLENAPANKISTAARCKELAEARKELMQFLEKRTQEFQTLKMQLSILNDQEKNSVKSIKPENSAELAAKKTSIGMINQLLKNIIKRRADYLQEMSRLEISDMPSPSPSPFVEPSPRQGRQFSWNNPTRSAQIVELPEAPVFEQRAVESSSSKNKVPNGVRVQEGESRSAVELNNRCASSPCA